MSKILRRPMFRGGPVDSRGTGITSGLMDGGQIGGGAIYGEPNSDGRYGFKKPVLGASQPNKFLDFLNSYLKPNETIEENTDEIETGGEIFKAANDRFSYYDPNALPGFKDVKRTMPIKDGNVSAEDGGQQLGDTDYLVERGFVSDVEKPVSKMSLEELIDYQLGEKGDVFQTGKSGLEKNRPREIKSTKDLNENELLDFRTNQMKSKNAAQDMESSRPIEIETAEDGSIKLVTDPTGNAEQKTELSARDLVRENAELFKEFLSEGNEKKLRDARIQDLSDLGLDIFAQSQKEGATVGSTLGGAAEKLVGKDSRVDKVKAQIDKSDQTGVALAINDYIAGKRSKEQIDAMLAKSDIGFAQAIALADYKKGKEDFFENLKENRKGMGSAEAIITTVQETFKKVPTVLTDKDIKQENFGLLNEENVGEYFVYPDGKVTKIDKIGNELTEVVIYTRGG
jgi:hypothetical protein